jgi:hypothetical protein
LAGYRDKIRKSLVILYDLDEDAQVRYKGLAEAFDKLKSASRKWNVETRSLTSDWKRNAGATNLLKRVVARTEYRVPSVVKTNIEVPSIQGGRNSLYFFPDVLLVEQGKRYAAFPYGEFSISWANTTFIENESPPKDSVVVGYNWKYTNKKGGPDRRFKNNRQFPCMQYQQMVITGPGELRKTLHISRVEDRSDFDNALRALEHPTLHSLPPIPERLTTSSESKPRKGSIRIGVTGKK